MANISFEELVNRTKIDFAFISELEPQSENKAYTTGEVYSSRIRAINSKQSTSTGTSRTDASKQTGVMVGIGFDLGSHTSEDLKKIGLNATLRGKLFPYLELKGEAAATYLAEKPLILSDAEVQAIDLGNRAFVVTKLVNHYNETSQVDFAHIPSAWQTVLASIACQYGEIDKKFPQFWQALTQQDWEVAMHILKNFGDSSPARRHREASYIMESQST